MSLLNQKFVLNEVKNKQVIRIEIVCYFYFMVQEESFYRTIELSPNLVSTYFHYRKYFEGAETASRRTLKKLRQLGGVHSFLKVIHALRFPFISTNCSGHLKSFATVAHMPRGQRNTRIQFKNSLKKTHVSETSDEFLRPVFQEED